MRKTILGLIFALAGACAMPVSAAEHVKVIPNGATPEIVGSQKFFTGHVVIAPYYPATKVTNASIGMVTFAPGARTVWHSHPLGQLLIVTDGKGWLKEEGQPKHVIKAGDVVWIPANVRHWHGATATSSLRHIALSYMKDGNNVVWYEPVTDQQYNGK